MCRFPTEMRGELLESQLELEETLVTHGMGATVRSLLVRLPR